MKNKLESKLGAALSYKQQKKCASKFSSHSLDACASYPFSSQSTCKGCTYYITPLLSCYSLQTLCTGKYSMQIARYTLVGKVPPQNKKHAPLGS